MGKNNDDIGVDPIEKSSDDEKETEVNTVRYNKRIVSLFDVQYIFVG